MYVDNLGPVSPAPEEITLPAVAPRQAITITDQPQVYQCPVEHCPHLIHLPDDGVIIAWLQEKTGKSRTWKTHVAYHSAILSLRATLRQHGYDLLMDLSADVTFAGYILLLQQWLETRAAASHHQGPISDRTYNQRLAIVSSFFEYAARTRLYRGENPSRAVQRRNVDDEAMAEYLEVGDLRLLLSQIDRKTIAGQRDYALICVALQTGQRGQALADMRIEHLTWMGQRLAIRFPQMKRGKSRTKLLEVETCAALSTYLQHFYGKSWQEQREAPVWVSLSRNTTYGQGLSIQAIEQLYGRRLATTKSHVTRHSAARALKELKVPVTDIQEFLDHENVATTNTYLKKRLKKIENKYGRDLEDLFGIRGTQMVLSEDE